MSGKKVILLRMLRFALVGGSGFIVDMTMLYLLSDPTTLHWGLAQSKAIGSELAIINNFFWNDRWTFGDLSRAQGSSRGRWFKRLVKFNIICMIGLVMNIVLLSTLVYAFGMNRYVANIIVILTVAFWNFFINLNLNWRISPVK